MPLSEREAEIWKSHTEGSPSELDVLGRTFPQPGAVFFVPAGLFDDVENGQPVTYAYPISAALRQRLQARAI